MQSLVISFQITFMGADSTISSGNDTFLVNLIYVNTDRLNSPTKDQYLLAYGNSGGDA